MSKRERVREQDAPKGPRLPALEKDLLDFIEEHEENIPIDENDLIAAQKAQTESHYAVAKRHAYETSRKDAAKQFLNMVKARVEDAIRGDARESGEKVTEATVASKILLSAEVVEAENMLLDATRRVRDVEALKDSFDKRSPLLRTMAELWIAGYYSDASTQGADRAVQGVRAKEVKREIARSKNRG